VNGDIRRARTSRHALEIPQMSISCRNQVNCFRDLIFTHPPASRVVKGDVIKPPSRLEPLIVTIG